MRKVIKQYLKRVLVLGAYWAFLGHLSRGKCSQVDTTLPPSGSHSPNITIQTNVYLTQFVSTQVPDFKLNFIFMDKHHGN